MNALPTLPAGWLYQLACGLEITQLDGGLTSLWMPNREQVRVWRAGERSLRRYITKSRRRGISTALDLEDCVWTKWLDEKGHRVRTGIVLHREDNLRERMFQMASFLQQLYGFGEVEEESMVNEEFEDLAFIIRFPGKGSEIFGITAGSSDSSRSEGAQRMRYEEYAFYKDGARGAISPSVSLNVPETICTTIDISAPNGLKARDMWRDPTNGFEKIFFRFDEAREYRADPDLISDEQWEWAKKEGWRPDRRDSAAYWLTEVLPNKCERDRIRAFREYPPTEEHMFRVSESRVIQTNPPAAIVDGYLEAPGLRGETWNVEIYGDGTSALEHSGQVVVAIDSAQGVQKTNSVVLAVDKRDRRILACFWDNRILHDDLARVAQWVAEFFKPRRRSYLHHDRVTVVCEADGAGRHTAHELSFLGVPHELFWQSKENNHEKTVTQAKHHIEARQHPAPKILQEECDELHRDEKNQLTGRKDCVMMYGVANVWIDRDPYVQPIDPVHEKDRRNRMSFESSLKDHEMQQRGRGKMPWGTT